MHNIKEIRTSFDNFKKKIQTRNVDLNLDIILDLDVRNRKFIQDKENLEKQKKEISKSQDKSLFAKSKEISKQIETLNKEQNEIKVKLEELLSSLPNLPLEEVPIGKDESSNKEIEKNGEIKKFDFEPKSHYELGEKLNMLDFDLASKTTGSRFVFVKDKLATLERAISNFMIDTHTQLNNYKEISPPLIANDSSMFGTGQLPKFENDQFELVLKKEDNDRKFLIPTAEVVLTNIVRESNLKKDLLFFLNPIIEQDTPSPNSSLFASSLLLIVFDIVSPTNKRPFFIFEFSINDIMFHKP